MKRKSIQNIFKDRKVLMIFLCLVMVSVFTLTIAYSAMSVIFQINGNAEVVASSWDIRLSNPQVKSGSVTTDVPNIVSGRTLKFSTTLNMPGDYYEFTVDVVNDGSIDAMIENVVKNPELTAEQVKYLNYEVSYANGESIQSSQTLKKHSSSQIKVRVEYRRDLNNSDLPTSSTTLDLSLTLEFIQSDGSGSDVTDNGYVKTAWNNTSMVFIGDSITYGASTTKTYLQYIQEDLSLSSAINMGINSSTISAKSDYGTTKSPLINRYTTVPDADLITIFMGTNDYGHETPLGTIDDTTDVSFYGALNVIIPWLIENRPNSRIVLMTPIHRYGYGTSSITGTAFTYDYVPNGRGFKLSDYVNALKAIGNKYSVPVIDLYNIFTLDPTDANTRTNYMPDGLHPNAAGHRLLADTIMNSLNYISKKTSSGSADSGDDTTDRITMQIGNQYDANYVSATSRISGTKNVYLKKNMVVSINDSSKYMYGVFRQSTDTVKVDTCLQVWTTDDYTVPSDGWYGIAIKKVDNVDFNFGGVDSRYLDDYVSFEEKELVEETVDLNIGMQLGNHFDANYITNTNRASMVNNIYLKKGMQISLSNSSVYNYAISPQTSNVIAPNIAYVTGSSWTNVSYTVTTDGWYGIAIKRVDNANFDLGGVDPGYISGYVNVN